MSRRLGVVIPTLRRPESVVRCVDSVLAGSVRPDVCVVVDQSDGDDTRDALRSTFNDPVLVYHRSAGRGLSLGLNEGVRVSGAQIVGITGDDCTVGETWLEDIRATFEAHPDVGVVFGTVLPASHDAARGFVPSYRPSERVLARTVAQKDRIGGTSACMAIRGAAWTRVGGFDESLGVGAPLGSAEDADLTLRALAKGIAVFEEPSIAVVHHGFFSWDERGALIWRNWYGTGAAFAKSFRLERRGSVGALWTMAWRWARRGSRVAAGLGSGSHRIRSLRAFLAGFREGLRPEIDRRTGHFLPMEGKASDPGYSPSQTASE